MCRVKNNWSISVGVVFRLVISTAPRFGFYGSMFLISFCETWPHQPSFVSDLPEDKARQGVEIVRSSNEGELSVSLVRTLLVF